jgi:cell division septum initiation protein DivIVA
MTKVLKKEKINYLKGSKPNLDNTISYDNISNNNISNNNINNININTTLTNISNQLKNIAIIDKNKEFKLNSSFHIKNKNRRNNNINSNIKSNNNSNNSNYYINTSMNIENNQNKSNFFDITTNLEINPKFQNLREMRVFNFYILKSINYENYNINYEDLKKENVDLKENIKFLLKQIKKYQKSGLTIEDMDINRRKELENYEKKINELKREINTYKNKIISLNKNNKELIKRNVELNDFINSNLNLKESRIRNKYNGSINNQEKEIEQFYDIDAFNEKSYEYNNLNMAYNSKKNLIESENNSRLSEELLFDINYEIPTGRNKSNFLYIKEFSINNSKRPRTNYSEGKLYCRKNIGKKYLNFNDDPYSNNIKISGNKNFTYSRSHLKNNISFKKQ